MELKFTKDAQSGNYVSELEVKAGFNLHIEGAKKLRLYQRTAGSRYDEIEGEYKNGPYSFDYDFDALVYPKYIKIVSEVEPTYAEVVSDGEITEIKSQSKEVEITANGTTQVAPDAGFSYLTGVSIKTNVPQSGGGTEASSMEYLDVSGVDVTENSKYSILLMYGIQAKAILDSYKAIIPTALAGQQLEMISVTSVSIDFSLQTNIFMGRLMSVKEYMLTGLPSSMRITEEELAAIPRITKEEFYNLEGGGITNDFVSIRELYQPTSEDFDMNTGNSSGMENCDRVTEIEFQSPSSYETTSLLGIALMNMGLTAMLSLVINTTDSDTRLVWGKESSDTGITSGVIFTITPEGTTSFNEEEFAKFNGYLSGDDFRYVVANDGKGFTDAEFDTIDKFIKVKTV